ncbi:hypothetical protein TIFTF001_012814 [Ficus carica]|uniref:Nudix hydrolase domain-containing protein n=1 Tax=Ficus carica TaxID=3494 RepID=A0AA88ANV7_FICCA|nr:hypothetical protein TIFTF001_012814 [Ficus carica]
MVSNGVGSQGAGLRRLETLARHFCLHKPPPLPDVAAAFPKRAAVLVCLFEGDDGNLRVILTKRASTLSSYSGEVSLPGGKVEEGDAGYVDTALRGRRGDWLGPFSSFDLEIRLEGSKFLSAAGICFPGDVQVVPVIGLLSNTKAFNPVPDTAEVEAIFDAPLEMFLKDENRRAEEAEWQGEEFICNFFDFKSYNKNYVIWALTAAILITVASLVYQRPPAFPERRLKIWSKGAARRASMPKID